MTYDPNIPVASHLVSVDISNMNTNFSQLNTIFNLDHYNYITAPPSNRGLHRQVTFPNVLSGDPALIAPSGELYTKAISAVTQLFFSNGTNVTQLTGLAESAVTNGKIIFNSGLQFKWGFVDTTYLAGVVDNQFFFYPDGPFVGPDPFPTTTFQVFIQGINNSTGVHALYLKSRSAGDLNKDGFKLRTDQSWPNGFMYFAIGN